MSNNYFNSTGTIGFTCDVCGRELQSCTWMNGMRFCAKCYQETFGASKDWQLLDKDKTIAEQRKQIADLEAKLAEKEKELEKLKEPRLIFQNKLDIEEVRKRLNAEPCIVVGLDTSEIKMLSPDQDKISFCIKQLVNIQKYITDNVVFVEEECFGREINEYIDNQIEELKKEMK